MKKVIENGKVAVLYSPGFGAGWSTWNDDNRIVFDSRIIEKVMSGKQSELTDEFMESLGYTGYWGGSRALKIKWLPEGTIFEIEEYDGNEDIRIIGERKYLIA